jgi:hypothetical protein
MRSGALRFVSLGYEISIRAEDSALEHLRANFAAMDPPASRGPDIEYRIAGDDNAGWHLFRDDVPVIRQEPPRRPDASGGSGRAEDEASIDRTIARDDPHVLRSLGELTYVIESDLIVRLQIARPDLLFVHAAALEKEGAVHLVTGHSGAGKSTTCWGLLHERFRYLSDEIAPIEVETGRVHAYPHALCMKRDPPPTHPVPAGTRRTSRGLHIPIGRDRLAAPDPPPVLKSVLFVEYDPERPEPAAHPVGPAEAMARLYPNVLNALAHENHGLSAVSRLSAQIAAYRLESAMLAPTCRLVVALLR